MTPDVPMSHLVKVTFIVASAGMFYGARKVKSDFVAIVCFLLGLFWLSLPIIDTILWWQW